MPTMAAELLIAVRRIVPSPPMVTMMSTSMSATGTDGIPRISPATGSTTTFSFFRQAYALSTYSFALGTLGFTSRPYLRSFLMNGCPFTAKSKSSGCPQAKKLERASRLKGMSRGLPSRSKMCPPASFRRR